MWCPETYIYCIRNPLFVTIGLLFYDFQTEKLRGFANKTKVLTKSHTNKLRVPFIGCVCAPQTFPYFIHTYIVLIPNKMGESDSKSF